jgi:uncharacterized protein YlxP (DUF503 family)
MASIGLLTLDLQLPYAHSLKEKRAVLLRVKDRLRHRFNVAVSELDHQDVWQRSTIGVTSISSNEVNLRQVLEGAQKEAESLAEEAGAMVNSTIELMEL